MSIRILVVDDEPKLQLLIKQLFRVQIKNKEFEFLFAQDGQEALDTLRQDSTIEIVITDINMPRMDGLTLLSRIKDLKTELNPVLTPVIISAYGDMQNIRKAMNVGGFDFLIKPIDLRDLKATIENTIAHARLLKDAIAQKQAAEEALREANQLLERRVEERTQALLEANLLLQESNKELDAFASTVAHNLKNPLSLVLGYTDLLSGSIIHMDVEDLNDLVERIRESGYKMDSIIEELLLLSSVRKGQVDFTIFNMGTLMSQVLQRLEPLIQQEEAEVTYPEEWPLVRGYVPWIEEVWINYLTNALKYGGSSPQITIGFTCEEDERARFWVQDKGTGIAPEDQENLFVEFTRLHSSDKEGHGLGLSIVRRIMKRLNGSVGVESRLGQGSLFYFTLPCA